MLAEPRWYAIIILLNALYLCYYFILDIKKPTSERRMSVVLRNDMDVCTVGFLPSSFHRYFHVTNTQYSNQTFDGKCLIVKKLYSSSSVECEREFSKDNCGVALCEIIV